MKSEAGSLRYEGFGGSLKPGTGDQKSVTKIGLQLQTSDFFLSFAA